MTHKFLEYIISKAEEMELGYGLTLYVKGLIVEGIPISEKKYFRIIIEMMRDRTQVTGDNYKTVEKINVDLEAFISKLDSERKQKMWEESKPEYIYLEEARVYSGSTQEFTEMPHWVGNLSSVDGFSLGFRQRS